MKAMVLEGGAGLDHLKLRDRPEPEAGPGEVLVRLKAASINYRDLATVTMMAPQRPLIPLSDGAGVVEAVGEGVSRVAVGDLVMPGFFPHWVAGRPTPQRLAALGGALDGVACEAIALTAEGVTKAPAGWSAEEAATLPCAAVTAWRGLVVEGRLTAGETVLVQGTGGVSIFALQFAKLAGARVIVTSSSDEKLERARRLGRRRDHQLPHHAGVGEGRARAHRRARRRPRGRGRRRGHLPAVDRRLRARRQYRGDRRAVGLRSGPQRGGDVRRQPAHQRHHGRRRETVEHMIRAIEVAKLKPIIDRHFALAQLPEALALMQSGGHFGKVVIEI